MTGGANGVTVCDTTPDALPVTPSARAVNENPPRRLHNRGMKTLFLQTMLCVAALSAQEVTFRSETRVVTIDVMVRDKVTRQPVGQLERDAFRLRIDGKERPISYFRHDGQDRRPLAMLIFFNLAPEGGLREMAEPAALKSFAAALGRLSGEDEVAVFATRDWFVGEAKEMCGLTRDRQAAAAAMQRSVDAALNTSAEERKSDRMGKEKSMSRAVDRALALAAQRPDSQIALVYVSDGMNTLDTMESRGRNELAEALQSRHVSFSAMNLQMLTSYAAAAAVINPLGKVFGLSVTGSGNYLAKQAGGVSVDVPSAAEFGSALDQVMSAYASRYSLGYQASETEYRDGRRHRIEVKVAGDAAKRLELSAPKGFAATSDKDLH